MPRRYVYLQSIGDALALAAGLPSSSGPLPPPGHELHTGHFGVHVGSLAYPAGEIRLPVFISFDDPSQDPHGWWTGTVADVLLALTGHEHDSLGVWIDRVSNFLRKTPEDVLAAPVVLKGQGEQVMRWLQSTFRGLLFGEAFQHKMDWGKPGDDPTTTETDALVLAQLMATQWSTIMGPSLLVAFPPDVVYTEVGVVELNQSDAGGDVTETYGTQWAMYPTTERPTGGSATTSLPYEVSCCVSLQTDHRGPSGKGRFYLPPFTKDGITVHGLFNMGVVSPVIVAIGDYIDSIKSSEDLVPIVVSRTKKILNEVTSINTGIVPDSQRRRRRSLNEARVAEWTA